MLFDLDLDELRKKESERIEWKMNVADIDNVTETIVAFANDYSNLGGGYIICGAEEIKDASGFQTVKFEGLTASRFKEIEGKVLSDCQNKIDPPVIPLIDEIVLPEYGKRILVFIMPSTEYAHSFKNSDGSVKYYIRVGRSTREARGAILRELLIRKKVLEPWDRRSNKDASITDYDLLIMREYLQIMGIWDPVKGLERYLSDKESISAFVPPLLSHQNLNTAKHPRNFSLLLFSAEPTRFIPGAYTILSVYPTDDRSSTVSERHEIAGTIVEQAKNVISRLNIEAYIAIDKSAPLPNQLKFPTRALQEAVVNALVHRDYESDQPTRVTVFTDRVEINSPGSLPRAVDKLKFVKGEATPYWRNQALAFFFNKLQLAQAEGQGITTILRTMQQEGCPEPIFQLGEDNVVCILPAHPRHKLIKQLKVIENNIVLGNHAEALLETEELLKSDPYNFRALELHCEITVLARKPQLSWEYIRKANLDFKVFTPSTLIVIAETLLLCSGHREATDLAHNLLNIAATGKLEEREIKKVAVGLRKLGQDEKAIEFLDKEMDRLPILRTTSSLLEIRAKAKIDLAKRCIETAKKGYSRPRIQALAWERCRYYLTEAERDLFIAHDNTSSIVEKDFIDGDMEFLRRLQEIAKKPTKEQPPRHSRR